MDVCRFRRSTKRELLQNVVQDYRIFPIALADMISAWKVSSLITGGTRSQLIQLITDVLITPPYAGAQVQEIDEARAAAERGPLPPPLGRGACVGGS